MSAKKAKGQDFAEAFKELEEIVGWFEDSEVDLEEGLKKFERGLELAQLCRGRLRDVENKVTSIKEKFSELGAEGGAESGGDDPENDDEQGYLL